MMLSPYNIVLIPAFVIVNNSISANHCCIIHVHNYYFDFALWLNILAYQSPLILTEQFQHNLINVSYLMACYLYQVMMTLHFLNDVANDVESTKKLKTTS